MKFILTVLHVFPALTPSPLRVYRLYRREGLSLFERRPKRHRPAAHRPKAVLSQAINGDVVRVIDAATTLRGAPQSVRVDSGPEFVSRVLDQWACANGVEDARCRIEACRCAYNDTRPHNALARDDLR